MSDPAQHDRQLIEKLHGEHPLCMEDGCSARAEDSHHLCKRGNKKTRKMHSSPYGAYLCCRKHHTQGWDFFRTAHYCRKVKRLLDEIGYTPTDNDRKFLEHYSRFYE